MTLGERLRQARREAGLTQRQLCGSEITRNMLSQIENGSANPSVATLRYLAQRLNRPVGYFLEEAESVDPGQAALAAAREAFARQDYGAASQALGEIREADAGTDAERYLLLALTDLALAEQAVAQKRLPYAAALLEQAGLAGEKTPYFVPALERVRWLLLAEVNPDAAGQLPDALQNEDRALLLRANAALARGDAEQCARLLDAVQDRQQPRWQLLRGKACLLQRQWTQAAQLLHPVEAHFPQEVCAALEQCYRELGDYRQAYEYACRRR